MTLLELGWKLPAQVAHRDAIGIPPICMPFGWILNGGELKLASIVMLKSVKKFQNV